MPVPGSSNEITKMRNHNCHRIFLSEAKYSFRFLLTLELKPEPPINPVQPFTIELGLKGQKQDIVIAGAWRNIEVKTNHSTLHRVF